jgi:hypothetical protein
LRPAAVQQLEIVGAGVGEFIQEVIDDFYEARGIDYYTEVMRSPGTYS